MTELLAPVGSLEKLDTALHFGADAVYLGGSFGLRAQTEFTDKDIAQAIEKAHRYGKKAYVTVNIYARNNDMAVLDDYLAMLINVHADGVIVSDMGIMSRIMKKFPALELHVSTQANTTNSEAARFYEEIGAKRIVLARETTLDEIKQIRSGLKSDTELEAFVHGAMCISYSGRCLLSNFFTGRDSNHGNCVQACRWSYALHVNDEGNEYPIEEDIHGTYILNSKDLMMIEHLGKMAEAGVTSFKIEGRMKTAYYLATVLNAYRRALNIVQQNSRAKIPTELVDELYKVSNRGYTTGFFFGSQKDAENTAASLPVQTYDFCAAVIGSDSQRALIEMRNRFFEGDILEVVSPYGTLNRKIKITRLSTEDGVIICDAKRVQQRLFIDNTAELKTGDLLRKKR